MERKQMKEFMGVSIYLLGVFGRMEQTIGGSMRSFLDGF